MNRWNHRAVQYLLAAGVFGTACQSDIAPGLPAGMGPGPDAGGGSDGSSACACGANGDCKEGGCRCDHGWAGASCDHCAAGFHALGELCLPDRVRPANYPLEIIQPRADLDSRNRFYRAYPGLNYNVRTAVIGGVYPFRFKLLQAPTGMTIDRNSGVIDWPSPTDAGSPHAISVSVTDQAGTTSSVSWPLLVTKDKFAFVDAAAGSDDNDGSIDAPWKTFAKVYGGNDYDAKYSRQHQDYFVYFKSGTYTTDGYTGGSASVQYTNRQPLVLLAFPGAKPLFDNHHAYLRMDTATDGFYADGITFSNMDSAPTPGADGEYYFGVRLLGSSSNVTIRRCRFQHLPSSPGSNNQSAVMFARDDGTFGSHSAIEESTFDDVNGYAIIGYTTTKVLFDSNTIVNSSTTGPIVGPKIDNTMWFIRANRVENVTNARVLWLYNGGGKTADQEVSFNVVLAPNADAALDVNGETPQSAGKAFIFRNTFVGAATFHGLTGSTGPFHLYENVIVNARSGYSCDGCSAPAMLDAHDNLVGAPSDGIVDVAGSLAGTFKSLCGERGYQMECP